MADINQAYGIALDNLRQCYGSHGIFAGLHHFKDYWARDSMFASLGSLSAKDHDIVKRNLSMFLNFMHPKGQLPLRIGKSTLSIGLSYLNLVSPDAKRKPVYYIDKAKNVSVDQNSLLMITFYEYIKRTKDRLFLKENISKLKRVMDWNLHMADEDNLMSEKAYCNWADSIKKQGKVLYTNVLHCHALYCFSDMLKSLRLKHEHYSMLHKEVKEEINKRFWSGEHYIDWIDHGTQYNFFSTDGNMLAILYDVADKEKAKKIEEAAHIFDINDIPSGCVHPPYPGNLISLQVKFWGLKDYHNGLSWLWLGCINALAKHKLGMKKDANMLLDKIADIIIKYGEVFEVYDKSGEPVDRLIYRSEHPFAWSSGLFVYAVNEIIR